MHSWTLAIAVFGTVVATASLTWNVVQFLLGGAWPKAQLILGMMSSGGGLVSGPPGTDPFGSLARLAEQGYTLPVIGVKVVNYGRAPVRVERWSVKCMNADIALLPPRDESIGPELPHDLPAGANGTWVIDLQLARSLAHAAAATFEQKPEPVHVVVELGTGKTLVSKDSLSVISEIPDHP